jgi:hypothetical protein
MQLFIDREVERTNRNLLLATLALAAVLVAAALLSAGYLRDLFGGPYPATLAELAAGRPAHAFVKLEGELLPTSYQHVETKVDKHSRKEKSRKVTADYLALHDGAHTLLVKAPVGTEGMEIQGWLRDPEKVDREVLSALRREEPAIAATWLPLVLDATWTRTWGIVGLVAAGLVLLLALRNLRAWSARRARPTTHPIWKKLAALGDARTLASQLDMEMRGTDVQRFKGRAVVTPSWLVRSSAFGLEAVPVDRLVWIHKKVTTQKKAFVTVSRTYEAVVCQRDGGQLSVRAPEAEVDRLLGELLRRAPWVLAGWSDELEKAWRSRRAEMIAAVDARRQRGGEA